jgi:membrane fusion protein (multidrug efflux system)
VKLDREVTGGWVVRDGLKEGEQIIVDGVMRVRPGAPVKASPMKPKQEAEAKSAPASGSAAGAKQ